VGVDTAALARFTATEALTAGVVPAIDAPAETVAVTGGVAGVAGTAAVTDTLTSVAGRSVTPWPAAAVLAYPSAASETTPMQTVKRGANIVVCDECRKLRTRKPKVTLTAAAPYRNGT
jgi:hypothetical protein